MRKVLKWIILVIVGLLVIGYILDFSETKPTIGYKVVDRFRDISGQFYHCQVVVLEQELKTLTPDDLKTQLQLVNKVERCGCTSFYYHELAIKYQENSNYADQNPQFKNDYFGKYCAATDKVEKN